MPERFEPMFQQLYNLLSPPLSMPIKPLRGSHGRFFCPARQVARNQLLSPKCLEQALFRQLRQYEATTTIHVTTNTPRNSATTRNLTLVVGDGTTPAAIKATSQDDYARVLLRLDVVAKQ